MGRRPAMIHSVAVGTVEVSGAAELTQRMAARVLAARAR